MSLQGKVGIVTGGARGIGKAIALALAKAGANVVIADLDEQAGEATVKDIEVLGPWGFFHKTDVSKREEANHLIDATVSRERTSLWISAGPPIDHPAPGTRSAQSPL